MRKRQQKAEHDRNIVTAILVSTVAVLVLFAGIGVSSMVQSTAATAAITGTLGQVRERQSQFHQLNQRFATWSELNANGSVMPPEQRLLASNQDASHWFLSIGDRGAGVICDDTGELYQDGSGARGPVCRPIGR